MIDAQLVDFAEAKDALAFKTALHDTIAQKVSAVLDHLRSEVASNLFSESDVGTPGDPVGGIDPEGSSSASAEGDAIETPGGASHGGLGMAQSSASYMPSPKGSVRFPGNTGGFKSQGAGPDLNNGAVDPNSPQFDRKGSTDTPSPLPANEEAGKKNKDMPDSNKGAKDPDEFNLKGKAKIPANESKWLQGAVHPERRGMFNGRSIASLKKQAAALRKSGPHKKGSAQATKAHQVNFAISRKENHGA